MGEIEAEKKSDEGAKKVDDSSNPVVYKLYLHCQGCVNKVKRIVSQFDGVETVQADQSLNKVTVTGKFDEVKLRDKLVKKTKKKVLLILPPPKNDEEDALELSSEKSSDEKKSEEKKPRDEKLEENKPEEKEEEKPTENTIVLKIKLHCEGCITKIENIIMKLEEVEMVNVDGDKDLVTVKGTMKVKDLLEFLKGKLKRNVDMLPPPPKKEKEKKEKDDGGKNKEKKKYIGGEKKSVEVIKHGDVKVEEREVKKMESSYPTQPPMYWYHGHVNAMGETSYAMGVCFQQPEHYHQQGYMNPPSYSYPVQQPQLPFYMHPPQLPFYMHPHHPPPQMFSDENPNACSII